MKVKYLRHDMDDSLQRFLFVEGSRLVFATLTQYQPDMHDGRVQSGMEAPRPWSEFEAWAKGLKTSLPDECIEPWMVNQQWALINSLPADSNDRHKKTFLFCGALVVNIASSKWGHDEIVDCSLFDILMTPDLCPRAMVNRMERTAGSKITYSARYRSYAGTYTVCNIFFPFATSDFADAEHIGVSYGLHQPLGMPSADVGRPGIPGSKLVEEVYRVVPDAAVVQVAEGGVVEIPFSVKWRPSVDYGKKGGELMTTPIDVTASSRSGYLPHTKIRTSEGRGVARFHALGLLAGETAKVKFGVGHMSKLGEITVEVVGA